LIITKGTKTRSVVVQAGATSAFCIFGILAFLGTSQRASAFFDEDTIITESHADAAVPDPVEECYGKTDFWGNCLENKHKLDVYYPDDPNGKIIVAVHGGLWRTRDKADQSWQNQGQMFSGHGIPSRTDDYDRYVYISINYRLDNNYDYKDQADDIALAIKYILDKYGTRLGTAQVILEGFSAGGHLAALVSTDESYLATYDLSLDNIAGTLLLDPAGLDMEQIYTDYRSHYNAFYGSVFGSPFNLDASPIFHAEGNSNIPEHMIITSLWEGMFKLPAKSYHNMIDAQSANYRGINKFSLRLHFGIRGGVVDQAQQRNDIKRWMKGL